MRYVSISSRFLTAENKNLTVISIETYAEFKGLKQTMFTKAIPHDDFSTLRTVAYEQLSDVELLGQFMVDTLIHSGGHFIMSAAGAELFFLDRKSGLLMPVDGSDQLRKLLASHGVVSSKKAIAVLCDFARPVAEIAEVHRLGWYDQTTNTVYVYSQGQEVFKVTETGIETDFNGCDGIYFLREMEGVPFKLANLSVAKGAFADFIKEVVFPASGILAPGYTLYLLLIWICCLFLSPQVTVMPVMLLIGEAGCGKTALMKLFSLLLSGNESALTKFHQDWTLRDKAITSRGFVVLDSMVECDEWVASRLESITGSGSIDIKGAGRGSVRTVLVDCRLAITARQLMKNWLPAFNMMLPIELSASSKRPLESKLKQRVCKNRDLLMTSIILLLQQIAVSFSDDYGPDYAGSCALGDFANIAVRLARVNDPSKGDAIADCFERLAAVATKATKTADDNLLKALNSWVAQHSGKPVTPPDLFAELEKIANDGGYQLEVSCSRFGHYLNKVASRLGQLFQVDKRQCRGRYQEYTFWLRPQ